MEEQENQSGASSSNQASKRNIVLASAAVLVLILAGGAFHYMKNRADLPPTLPPLPPSIDEYGAPEFENMGSTTEETATEETAVGGEVMVQ